MVVKKIRMGEGDGTTVIMNFMRVHPHFPADTPQCPLPCRFLPMSTSQIRPAFCITNNYMCIGVYISQHEGCVKVKVQFTIFLIIWHTKKRKM